MHSRLLGLAITAVILLTAMESTAQTVVGLTDFGPYNDQIYRTERSGPQAIFTAVSKFDLPKACFERGGLGESSISAQYLLLVKNEKNNLVAIVRESRTYQLSDFQNFSDFSSMMFWDLKNRGLFVPGGNYTHYLDIKYQVLIERGASTKCMGTLNGLDPKKFLIRENIFEINDSAHGTFEIVETQDETIVDVQRIEADGNKLLSQALGQLGNEVEQRYKYWSSFRGVEVGRLSFEFGDWGTAKYLGGEDLKIQIEGSDQMTTEQLASTFFETYYGLYPLDWRVNSLETLKQQWLENKEQFITVRQLHQGVGVFGTDTTLVIDANRNIGSVDGYFVSGIKESSKPSFSVNKAIGTILSQYPDHKINRDGLELLYKPNAGDRYAPLCWKIETKNPKGSDDLFYVSAHDLKILDHSQRPWHPDGEIYPMLGGNKPFNCSVRSEWSDSKIAIVIRDEGANYVESTDFVMSFTIDEIEQIEDVFNKDFCSEILCSDNYSPAACPTEIQRVNKLRDTCGYLIEFQYWLKDENLEFAGNNGPYHDLCVDLQVHNDDWDYFPIGSSPAQMTNGWFQGLPSASVDDVVAHELGHRMTPSHLYYSKWCKEASELLADTIAVSFDDEDWLIAEDKPRVCPNSSCGFCEDGYPSRSWEYPESIYTVREGAPFHPSQMTDYHTYMSDSVGSVNNSNEVQHINATIIGHAIHMFTDGGTKNKISVYGQGRAKQLGVTRNIFSDIPSNLNYDGWRRLLVDKLPHILTGIGVLGEEPDISLLPRGAMIDALDAIQLWSNKKFHGVSNTNNITQASSTNGLSSYEYKTSALVSAFSQSIYYRVKKSGKNWSTWKNFSPDGVDTSVSGGVRAHHTGSRSWWAWSSSGNISVTKASADSVQQWDPNSFEQKILTGSEFEHSGDPVVIEYEGDPWVFFTRNGELRVAYPNGADWQNDDWTVSGSLTPGDTVETSPALGILNNRLYVFFVAYDSSLNYGLVRQLVFSGYSMTPAEDIKTPAEAKLQTWFEGCTSGLSYPVNSTNSAQFNKTVSSIAAVKAGQTGLVLSWIYTPENNLEGPDKSFIYTQILKENDAIIILPGSQIIHREQVRTPIAISDTTDPQLQLGFENGMLHMGFVQPSSGDFTTYPALKILTHVTQYLEYPDPATMLPGLNGDIQYNPQN